MSRTLTTPPTAEPITLAEAKAHLRVDITDDDTLITALIVAAREYAEGVTRRPLVTQTWDLFLDQFSDEIDLAPNLQSVEHLKYIDGDGNKQTLDSGEYDLDIVRQPGQLLLGYGKGWPSIRSVRNAVEIRYVAGYGEAADVPQEIKQAMLMHIGHLYRHRESVVIGTISSEVPTATDSLLWPYRVLEF